MQPDRTTRRHHAQALLEGLHPRYYGEWSADLAERAMQSPIGRRQLARAALKRVPSLWTPDQERWQAWLAQEPWLAWPQARVEAFARELGVLSLGPALRLAVEREVVLFLRQCLGVDALRQAQAHDPWKGKPPEAIRHMGQAVLQRGGRDVEALDASVLSRGIVEFLAHAERSGPVLAARLSCAFASVPPGPCTKESWLPTGTVAALLQERAAHDMAMQMAEVTQEIDP